MKTALLVIDYINGIVNGSCKAYIDKHPIIDNTNKLIVYCRELSIPIYFIRLAFDAGYSNIPKHSKLFNQIKENKLYQLGDTSTEFIPTLNFSQDDIVLNKTAASPFSGTNLDRELKENNIERLIFSGISTDNAINIGAREANDLGYYTIIVKDACGGATEEFHEWTIAMLDKITNEIISVNEIASCSNPL